MHSLLIILATVCVISLFKSKVNHSKFSSIAPSVDIQILHFTRHSKFLKLGRSQLFFRKDRERRRIELHLAALLLLLSGDIHPNPGPKSCLNNNQDSALENSVFPCGCCEEAVDWSSSGGIICEGCEIWYHRVCASLTHSRYESLGNSSHVWVCKKCDTSNFSNVTFLYTSLTQIPIGNSFVPLSGHSEMTESFLTSPIDPNFSPSSSAPPMAMLIFHQIAPLVSTDIVLTMDR